MSSTNKDAAAFGQAVTLPAPDHISALSFEQALRLRRSTRQFLQTPLKLKDLSQLLWAAQGITGAAGLRTTPSAGETYPLHTYLIAGQVEQLPAGLYTYRTTGHQVTGLQQGDLRQKLATVALDQEWIRQAAAIVIFAAEAQRTTRVYGERGQRYVYMESGAAGQNLCNQASSLGLGAVLVGAFQDDAVAALLQLPAEVRPLLCVSIGNLP